MKVLKKLSLFLLAFINSFCLTSVTKFDKSFAIWNESSQTLNATLTFKIVLASGKLDYFTVENSQVDSKERLIYSLCFIRESKNNQYLRVDSFDSLPAKNIKVNEQVKSVHLDSVIFKDELRSKILYEKNHLPLNSSRFDIEDNGSNGVKVKLSEFFYPFPAVGPFLDLINNSDKNFDVVLKVVVTTKKNQVFKGFVFKRMSFCDNKAMLLTKLSSGSNNKLSRVCVKITDFNLIDKIEVRSLKVFDENQVKLLEIKSKNNPDLAIADIINFSDENGQLKAQF